MSKNKTIVMLYAEWKEEKPSEAIKEYIQSTYNDCDCIKASEEKLVSGFALTFDKKLQLFFACKTPYTYDFFNRLHYKLQKPAKKAKKERKPDKNGELKPPKLTGAVKRTRNLVKRFEPDIIVASTPKTLSLAERARNQMGLDDEILIYAMSSNYSVEKRMVSKGCDGYVVANEKVKKYLIKKGIDEDKIHDLGIALPSSSFTEIDSTGVYESLALPEDMPIITVIPAKFGAGFSKKMLKDAKELTREACVVFCTRGNKSLAKRAEQFAKTLAMPDRLRIVKSEEKISELIAISKAIYTTPQTDIIYEGLSRLVPTIISKPCGYAQTKTANYFLKEGLVINGNSDRKLAKNIENLIFDNRFETHIIEDMVEFSKTDASEEIGDLFYQIANDNYNNRKKNQLEGVSGE